MGMIIAGHNKKLLDNFRKEQNPVNQLAPTCNCRVRRDCPLDGNCLQVDTLYNAKITTPGEPTKNYIGIAATTFKLRYSKQNHSQSTTLSKYYWQLKDQGKNPSVSYSIIRVAPSYTPESGRCSLCTAEKLEILKSDQSKIVNSRNEIMAKCRHKAKFKLDNMLKGGRRQKWPSHPTSWPHNNIWPFKRFYHQQIRSL